MQVGTTNFINPAAAVEISMGIVQYYEAHSISDVAHLVGAMSADSGVSVIQSWL